MFSDIIAPKKRRSLKKSEKEECLFLDDGGLLTSEEIQEKIALKEAKRAEAKEAKAASQEAKRISKLQQEEKKLELQAKRTRKANESKAQAEAKAPAQLNYEEPSHEKIMIEV